LSERTRSAGPFRGVTSFVCIASALMSSSLGLLAGIAYAGSVESGIRAILGASLGGGIGLVAGVLWSKALKGIAARKGHERLPDEGALLGMLSGFAAAIVLHVGLVAILGPQGLPILYPGIVFGLVAGAILGAIGGAKFRRAARMAFAPAARRVAP
jgi:hypothetical protein